MDGASKVAILISRSEDNAIGSGKTHTDLVHVLQNEFPLFILEDSLWNNLSYEARSALRQTCRATRALVDQELIQETNITLGKLPSFVLIKALSFLERLPKLQRLSIHLDESLCTSSDGNEMLGQFLAAGHRFALVESLSITVPAGFQLTLMPIQVLASTLRQILSLQLQLWGCLPAAALAALQPCSALQRLYLRDVTIVGDASPAFSLLRRLTNLEVENVTFATHARSQHAMPCELLYVLQQCTMLQHLCLQQVRMQGDLRAAFASMPDLTHLELISAELWTLAYSGMVELPLPVHALEALTSLQELSIMHCWVADLHNFPRCTSITRLEAFCMTCEPEPFDPWLVHMVNLRHLDLNGCQGHVLGLQWLAPLQKLSHLHFGVKLVPPDGNMVPAYPPLSLPLLRNLTLGGEGFTPVPAALCMLRATSQLDTLSAELRVPYCGDPMQRTDMVRQLREVVQRTVAVVRLEDLAVSLERHPASSAAECVAMLLPLRNRLKTLWLCESPLDNAIVSSLVSALQGLPTLFITTSQSISNDGCLPKLAKLQGLSNLHINCVNWEPPPSLTAHLIALAAKAPTLRISTHGWPGVHQQQLQDIQQLMLQD